MAGPTKAHIDGMSEWIARGWSERSASAKVGIKRTTFTRWMRQGRDEDTPATDMRAKFVDAVETAEDLWVGGTEQELNDNEAAWVKIRLLESRRKALYAKAGGLAIELDSKEGTAKIVVAPDFPGPEE